MTFAIETTNSLSFGLAAREPMINQMAYEKCQMTNDKYSGRYRSRFCNDYSRYDGSIRSSFLSKSGQVGDAPCPTASALVGAATRSTMSYGNRANSGAA